MYPPIETLGEIDVLSELSTMLCIGDEFYCRSFPFKLYVQELISRYKENITDYSSIQGEINNFENVCQYKILVLRCISLILKYVPHSSKSLCSQTQVNLTHHLFEFLGDVLLLKGKFDFSQRNCSTELFEEWISCLESIALLQAETIDVSALVNLLEELGHIQGIPKSLVEKLITVLGYVIQKLSNQTQFIYISVIIEKLLSLFREELLHHGSTTAQQLNSRLLSEICDCFAILIKKFERNEEILRKIATGESETKISLATQLVSLIPHQSANISSLSKVVKVLLQLCSCSKESACQVLQPSNLNIILSTLTGMGNVESIHIDQSQLINRVKDAAAEDDIITEVLLLLRYIIPRASTDGIYTSLISPVHQWFWEDDYHNMNQFDAYSSKQLETGFNQNKPKIIILRRYEVVFSEMKQYNVSTRQQRCVKRAPIPCEFEREMYFYGSENIESVSKGSKKRKVVRDLSSSTEKDPRYLFLNQNDEAASIIVKNVISSLSEVLEIDSSTTTLQDIAIILGSLFSSISNNTIRSTAPFNDLIRLISKMLTNATAADGSNDEIVISHCLVTLKRCVDSTSSDNIAQSILLKNGTDKIIEGIILAMVDGTLKSMLDDFYTMNLKNIKHTRTAEENLLEYLCNRLRTGEEIDMRQLENTFLSESEISEHQFQGSGFVPLFLSYLHSNNDIMQKFHDVIERQPNIIRTLVSLLNSMINSNLSFTESICSEDLNLVPDDLYKLENHVSISLTKNETTFSEQYNQMQLSPFLTIKELKNEIFKSEGDEYRIFCQDRSYTDHQTILEIVFQSFDSKNYHEIWSNTCKLEVKRVDTVQLNSIRADFSKKSSILENATYLPDDVKSALQLLRLLYNVSKVVRENGVVIESSAFYNTLLSSKFANLFRTGTALLYVALKRVPQWSLDLISECFFLFPLPTKLVFFFVTQFGAVQALTSSYHSTAEYNHEFQHRSKIIDRYNILPEAKSILKRYSGTRTILEFEYEMEAGIGLGPTLEFYSLTATALQSLNLNMWLSENDSNAPYVYAPKGLFPCELPTIENERLRVLENFEFLGRFIGKCIEDNRLVDLPLSPAFLKLLLGIPLKKEDISTFESEVFYTSILSLCKYRDAVSNLNMIDSLIERNNMQKNLADLISGSYLTFQFRNINLIENGDEVDVTINNVHEYIEKLLQFLLVDMSKEQVEATKRGLSEILDLEALSIFQPDEFHKIFSGEKKMWGSREQIERNIILSGYSLDSETIQWFIEFLVELSEEEQCQFLEFTTGCTTLPVGGFAALKPKLQIVKSITRSSGNPDTQLPTCNTCFHYFKLPEYSSKEILFKHCKMALQHGRKSFDLT